MDNVIYVFIDSSNVWEAFKAKGYFLDWEKTKQYIINRFKATSIKVFFYTAYPAEGTRTYSTDKKHKFFTYLKKGLGFEVRKKELKRISTVDQELGECIKEKGNMDVEIAIDAMYHINKYDMAIFFTGDSDFLALISHIKNHGKKTYIFSSENNISEELRTGGGGYTDLLDIKEDIWGYKLKHRSELEKEEKNN